MLRKTLIALAATATLGVAALAPTSASAHWRHHGFHGFDWGLGYAGYNDCFLVKKHTRHGVRYIRVCTY